MAAFQQKTIIKSYKLRIKNKLKSIVEETDNVTTSLHDCVQSFKDETEALVNANDENFYSEYEILDSKFEVYREKLFLLLASLDQNTDEEANQLENTINPQEDVQIQEELKETQSIENCPDQNSSQTFCKTPLSSGTSVKTSSFCSLQDDYQMTNLSESKGSIAANEFTSHQPQESLNTQPKSLQHSHDSNLHCDFSSKSSSYQSLSPCINASKVSKYLESTHLDVYEADQCDSFGKSVVSSKAIILPPLISVPSIINAMLSHIVSPDDFWMQLEDSKKLRFQTLKFGKKTSPLSVQPGDFCFALSNKVNMYYRARVLTETSADRSVEVFFVDFGSIEKVPIKNLRKLPKEEFETPMRAFHCSLFNIVSKNGVWSAASIQKFKNYAGSCEVHVKSYNDGKYGVQLMLKTEMGFLINVSEVLCDEGFAVNIEELSENIPSSPLLTDKTSIQQVSHDSGVSITFNQKFSPLNERLCFSSEMINNRYNPFDHLHNLPQKTDPQVEITELDQMGKTLSTENLDVVYSENAYKSRIEVESAAPKYPSTNDCDYSLHQVTPTPHYNSSESFARMLSDDVFNSRELAASRCLEANDSEFQLHQSSNPPCASSASFETIHSDNLYNSEELAASRCLGTNNFDSQLHQHSNHQHASSESFERMYRDNDRRTMELAVSRHLGAIDCVRPLHQTIESPHNHFNSAESFHGMCSANAYDVQFENKTTVRCLRTIDCGCPLHLVVPPPLLNTDEEGRMLVMISNIVSPSEFHLNLAMEDSITLDELLEEMTAFYESHFQDYTIALEDLRKGMFCAGRFHEDQSWYRVKLLQVDDNGIHVQVQYIDYGNKAIITCYDLRPLKEEFVQHPAFALECSLAGIVPLVMTIEEEYSPWDPVAVEEFKKIANYDRCLTAEIVKHSALPKPRETIPVLLWDTVEAQDLLINEALVFKNVATFHKFLLSKGTDQKIETEILKRWNPMVEKYDDIENSYAVDEDDVGICVSGYKPNDDSRICRYFSLRDGFCPKGDKCEYEHVLLGEGGVTRDQVEDYSLDPVPSLPSIPCEVLLQVSSVVNPERFYAVLPFGNKTIGDVDSLLHRGSKLESDESDEVTALFRELNDYYSDLPFDENTTVALSYGSIVVAWRAVDSSWHRARIIDVSDVAGPATVFFVDFGDTSEVPRKKIRTILPQYLHAPFQAIECHMADIEPLGFEKGKRWSAHSINYFKQIVSGATFLAHILSKRGKVLVVILRGTTESDKNYVCESLVHAGFAQYRCKSVSKKVESIYVPG